MWQPRTFIVRFYPSGGRIAGVVEDSGTGRRSRFLDKDELWAFMHRPVRFRKPDAKESPRAKPVKRAT